MRHEALFWLRVLAWSIFTIGAGLALFDAGDWPHWDVVAMVALLVALVTSISLRMATERDDAWLPPLVVSAFALNLAGAAARWYVLVDTYDRSGDAIAYHNRALALADVWRSLEVPSFSVGGAGTTFASRAFGLIYVPHEPSSLLGGFFLLATVAFGGQLLLYAAFRRSLPHARLRLYAALVLMLPSLVFWPSSIGKEALMLLFLGIAAWGLAGLLSDYRFRWVPVIAAGTLGAAGVRPHVAALLTVAGAGAILLSRGPETGAAHARRLVVIGLAAVTIVGLLTFTSETFGIDTSGDDIDPFLDEIQRRTQQGGSAVEGEAALSLSAIPGATLKVLFRPLPTEATSTQAYMQAFESTALLLVIIWKAPRMIRSLAGIRRHPYLMFSLGFTLGFIVIFSAIFNLGILARQRTQALPFLLALLVGLGWPHEEEPPEETELVSAPSPSARSSPVTRG